MATERERPYGNFNFTVSWDGLDGSTPRAGFTEVSGLGMEIEVIEYRAGNSLENTPMKLSGLTKFSDVTLKRGLIGALDLFEWIAAVRDGAQDARRTVKIRLLSEDRQEVAVEWTLRRAWPAKYDATTLNAKDCGDVAIEELTLTHEGLELE